MFRGDPSWLSTVAREYAGHGAIDDALVQAATAAEVGLVQVRGDGTVWWSDETYRLHGRPRWVRVRSLEDLAWGLAPNVVGRVRTAYTDSLTDPDVDVRYTATGEHGPDRDLVLKALDRGVLVVHRATSVVDLREADGPTSTTDAPDDSVMDADVLAAQPISAPDQGQVTEPATPLDEEQALASAVLKATPDLVLLYDIGSRRVLTMAGNDSETAHGSSTT